MPTILALSRPAFTSAKSRSADSGAISYASLAPCFIFRNAKLRSGEIIGGQIFLALVYAQTVPGMYKR